MQKKCDKCHSRIVNSKCDCGQWLDGVELPRYILDFERAIDTYNKYCPDGQVLSCDHHSGTCFVFFKGDCNDCDMVKEFINCILQ
jgi:hypothetical protein